MKEVEKYIRPFITTVVAILSAVTVYQLIKNMTNTILYSLAIQFIWNYAIVSQEWNVPQISTSQAFLVYMFVMEIINWYKKPVK